MSQHNDFFRANLSLFIFIHLKVGDNWPHSGLVCLFIEQTVLREDLLLNTWRNSVAISKFQYFCRRVHVEFLCFTHSINKKFFQTEIAGRMFPQKYGKYFVENCNFTEHFTKKLWMMPPFRRKRLAQGSTETITALLPETIYLSELLVISCAVRNSVVFTVSLIKYF